MTDNSGWTVDLETPASTRFLHIHRLTSSGAAAEAGLTAEQVEDVKIAVDELCSIVIASAGDGDILHLRFLATEGQLIVEIREPQGVHLEVDELTQTILDATVDELHLNEDQVARGVRFVKRRSGN